MEERREDRARRAPPVPKRPVSKWVAEHGQDKKDNTPFSSSATATHSKGPPARPVPPIPKKSNKPAVPVCPPRPKADGEISTNSRSADINPVHSNSDPPKPLTHKASTPPQRPNYPPVLNNYSSISSSSSSSSSSPPSSSTSKPPLRPPPIVPPSSGKSYDNSVSVDPCMRSQCLPPPPKPQPRTSLSINPDIFSSSASSEKTPPTRVPPPKPQPRKRSSVFTAQQKLPPLPQQQQQPSQVPSPRVKRQSGTKSGDNNNDSSQVSPSEELHDFQLPSLEDPVNNKPSGNKPNPTIIRSALNPSEGAPIESSSGKVEILPRPPPRPPFPTIRNSVKGQSFKAPLHRLPPPIPKAEPVSVNVSGSSVPLSGGGEISAKPQQPEMKKPSNISTSKESLGANKNESPTTASRLKDFLLSGKSSTPSSPSDTSDKKKTVAAKKQKTTMIHTTKDYTKCIAHTLGLTVKKPTAVWYTEESPESEVPPKPPHKQQTGPTTWYVKDNEEESTTPQQNKIHERPQLVERTHNEDDSLREGSPGNYSLNRNSGNAFEKFHSNFKKSMENLSKKSNGDAVEFLLDIDNSTDHIEDDEILQPNTDIPKRHPPGHSKLKTQLETKSLPLFDRPKLSLPKTSLSEVLPPLRPEAPPQKQGIRSKAPPPVPTKEEKPLKTPPPIPQKLEKTRKTPPPIPTKQEITLRTPPPVPGKQEKSLKMPPPVPEKQENTSNMPPPVPEKSEIDPENVKNKALNETEDLVETNVVQNRLSGVFDLINQFEQAPNPLIAPPKPPKSQEKTSSICDNNIKTEEIQSNVSDTEAVTNTSQENLVCSDENENLTNVVKNETFKEMANNNFPPPKSNSTQETTTIELVDVNANESMSNSMTSGYLTDIGLNIKDDTDKQPLPYNKMSDSLKKSSENSAKEMIESSSSASAMADSWSQEEEMESSAQGMVGHTANVAQNLPDAEATSPDKVETSLEVEKSSHKKRAVESLFDEGSNHTQEADNSEVVQNANKMSPSKGEEIKTKPKPQRPLSLPPSMSSSSRKASVKQDSQHQDVTATTTTGEISPQTDKTSVLDTSTTEMKEPHAVVQHNFESQEIDELPLMPPTPCDPIINANKADPSSVSPSKENLTTTTAADAGILAYDNAIYESLSEAATSSAVAASAAATKLEPRSDTLEDQELINSHLMKPAEAETGFDETPSQNETSNSLDDDTTDSEVIDKVCFPVGGEETIAITLYDFEGEEGELSFKAHEEVTVLKWVNKDWLWGKISDKTGNLPANFVDFDAVNSFEENINPGEHIEPLVNDAPAPSTDALEKVKQVKGYARALYDYVASTKDDLNLKEGDRIEVLEYDKNWSYGCLNKKVGHFPTTFVSFEEDLPDDGLAPTYVVKALFDFEGKAADELSFMAGDMIFSLGELKSCPGWSQGTLNFQTGIFPTSFVSPVDSEP